MPIHIIIDGYNLIRQSVRLSGFERQDVQLGRDALIEALAAYRKKRPHKITVVFDGVDTPSLSPHKTSVKGIEIMFSRAGETADDVIKLMAAIEKEKALVVSSDRDLIHCAISNDAASISSPLFEKKLTLSVYGDNNEVDAGDGYGWIPSTKKKGPRRRLSKKERKKRVKTGKL